MAGEYDPPYEAIGLAITGFNDVEFMLHLSLAQWRYVEGGTLDLSVTSTLQLAPLLRDFRKYLAAPLKSDPTLADEVAAAGNERHRIAHSFFTPEGAARMRDFLQGTAVPMPLTCEECLDFAESCDALHGRLLWLQGVISVQRPKA